MASNPVTKITEEQYLAIDRAAEVRSNDRQDILLNPAVIFEVLSPSTEHDDRGVKFQYYRAVESLRDYVLVDQNQVRVEQYTRGEAGTWTLHDYQRLTEDLIIPSINVRLPLTRIYEGIEFSELPATSAE